MKKFNLFVLFSFIIISFTSFSCDNMCLNGGKGTLSVENRSLNTVQRLMINGVNYGSVDPGETLDVELNPGVYEWQLVGLSGGTGCSAAVVTINECETSSFSCSGK